MTVITQEFDYLEDPYLAGSYLTTNVYGNMGFQATIVIATVKPVGFQANIQIVDFLSNNGMQANLVIDTETALGFQALLQIADFLNPVGFQAEITIVDFLSNHGMQANVQIADFLNPVGFQATIQIADYLNPIGFQSEVTIADFQSANGMQALISVAALLNPVGYEARVDKALFHRPKGYLTTDYLAGPYLDIDGVCLTFGMQAEIIIFDLENPIGFQAEITIVDYLNLIGFQSEITIADYLNPIGFQSEITIVDFLNPIGFQAEVNVSDFLNPIGFQSEITIADYLNPIGFQVELQTVTSLGFQARIAIYNTTNLRILCSFPSRGVVESNWVASSTEPGDHDVNNVNSDIVEQHWRSETGTITGITLDSDTGLTQGVAVDTVAILGTNITTSATVQLLGSNSAIFATIDRTIDLQPLDNGNMYHISETLPLTQQRYWRLAIDDNTQTDGFLKIGVILFGASEIFQGECFVDEITFQQKDFTKTVRTEGQTNVSNSRSQKRKLGLEFRSLFFEGGNYEVLRDLFETNRTVLKCLWIPTPDPVRPTVTDRYAVFAKLSEVPVERHNNKGPSLTFVSFTVDLDESL